MGDIQYISNNPYITIAIIMSTVGVISCCRYSLVGGMIRVPAIWTLETTWTGTVAQDCSTVGPREVPL